MRQRLRIGETADDTDQGRLQKALFRANTVLGIAASLAWGGLYLAVGRPLAAALPGTYAAVMMLGLASFAFTGRYRALRLLQLALILVLPVGLQAVMGGFAAGSAVILWGLFSPLGALLVAPRRVALGSLVAYAALVVLSGFLEPRLAAAASPLSAATRDALFVLNVLGVATAAFVVVVYFQRRKDEANERSERLLLNVLPQPVVERLKREPGVIADAADSVTILFADIVDFTPFTSRVTPAEAVTFLNELFSEFDRLAGRHGLEKIKTIGDAYMAAAGLPEPRADHAVAAAEMALGIRELVSHRTFPDGTPLRCRIGLHTGPVVAGVIGTQKFIYDTWGDTVNIASRMESQGVPGEIHVTAALRTAIEERGFRFTDRGEVEVRGIGPMRTYLLRGRRDDVLSSPRHWRARDVIALP